MARGRLKGIKKPHPLGSLPSRSGVSLLTAESGITTSILPGVKISGLPVAGAATETDQFEVNQGGASRRITIDQLLDVTDGAYLALAGGTLTGPLAGTTAAFSAAPAYPNDSTSVATTAFVMDALAGGGGGPPSGVAGGDLAGTYPNPTAIKASGAFAVTGALTGTTATMSGNIISTGGNISAQGGSVFVDRTGDAAAATIDVRADAGQVGTVLYRTGGVERWQIRKNATAEGGSNAGSDLEIIARTDAGGALSTPLTITRSTGTVTLTGALTGTTAAFSGAVGVNGTAGNAKLKSSGIDTDLIALFSGTTKGVRFVTNATETRIEGVDTTGTGSFQPLFLSGSAVNAPTPTAGDNTTKIATTAFVTAAVAAAPAAVAPLNRLHNAALLVCDRGTGPFGTGVTTYAYGFNRWAVSAGAVAGTFTRVQAAKGLGVTISGAAGNTSMSWAQGLESGDCTDLASQPMCIGAVVSSSHLTTMSWKVSYCNTTNSHNARTQIATGTFPMTTTPTLQTATFNAGANAINGLVIEFFTAALVAGRTWTLSQPQLVTGSTPITFWVRSTAEETNVCRRYYQASGNNWTGVFMSAGNPGGMATRDTFPFSPPLFRSPDMAYTGQPPSTVFFADYIAWSGEWNTTAPNPDGRYLFGYTAEAEPVL